MIYKQVTNMLIDTLKHFKGVNYVTYKGDDLINKQHNNKTIQVYIDDISHHQFNLTTNIVKAEYQVYILGFPEDTPEDILNKQDECYNVAINTLAYINLNKEFEGIIRVYDYSILTLSHFSAQNNAGVKLSIVFEIPNGVDICQLEDNFGEPNEEETDNDIDVDEDEIGEIDLKPVKLKKNGCVWR